MLKRNFPIKLSAVNELRLAVHTHYLNAKLMREEMIRTQDYTPRGLRECTLFINSYRRVEAKCMHLTSEDKLYYLMDKSFVVLVMYAAYGDLKHAIQ